MTDDTDTDETTESIATEFDGEPSDAADLSETAEPDAASTAPEPPSDTLGGRSLTEWLELGALAGLVGLVGLATLGFYTSASTAIDTLVTATYEPLFQAGFNLVVLFLALGALSVLLRRHEGSLS